MRKLPFRLLGRKRHPQIRLRLAVLTTALLLSVPSLAYAAQSPRPMQDETYIVEDGDTLLGIALSYDVELDDLVAVNGIADPNFLQVGQQLTIPSGGAYIAHLSDRSGARPQMVVPAPGGISTLFGEVGWYWRRGWHTGIDYASSYGDTVLAALDGIVIESEFDQITGYGSYIKIDHGDGLHTLYAHLSNRLVSIGDRVERGEPIGLVGDSGFAIGPHLHFEVRQYGEHLDPLQYLP